MIVLPAVLVVAVWAISTRPHEEPFTWLQGISVWPAELLRLFAGLLSVYLVAKGFKNLKDNVHVITNNLALPVADISPVDDVPEKHESARIRPKVWNRLHSFWNRMLQRWRFEEIKTRSSVQDIWKDYVELGSFRERRLGISLLFVLYILLGITIMAATGLPTVPFRGPMTQGVDIVMLFFSIPTFIFLNFFVVDATRLCETKLIQPLSTLDYSTAVWAQKNRNPVIDRWRVLELVAKRTEAVQPLVIYPFLVIVILMLSRSSYFDRWTWSLGLVIVITIHTLFALSSAFVMRRGAEKLRRIIRDDLATLLVEKKGSGDPHDKHTAEQIEIALREIDSLQTGAFSPLSRQPLIRAILLPFAGLGSLKLMDYLATSQW